MPIATSRAFDLGKRAGQRVFRKISSDPPAISSAS